MKTFIFVMFVLLNTIQTAFADAMINGAGATFPYPLYTKWFAEYNKLAPHVKINYQSIGSGGGIRLLLDRYVDFAASDIPMSDKQLAKAFAAVVHIPTALGAVVLSYNVPGLVQPLQLSGELLADLFLGKIKSWNDKRILELNPTLKVPSDLPVSVVHRSDGSGTSAIFTSYLTKISPEWQTRVGTGTAVNWPAGLGAKGNEGVAGFIKQNPGSIGYVELIFAENNRIPYAKLRNRSGEFVLPTLQTLRSAVSGVSIPDDLRANIVDPEGKEAYPICGMTYLLVLNDRKTRKSEAFQNFLRWSIRDGQKYIEPLTYAPLPPEFLKRVEAKIETLASVTVNP